MKTPLYLRMLCLLPLLLPALALTVGAIPYNSYIYEKQTGAALRVPAAMAPQLVVDGGALGTTPMKTPEDAVADSQGNLYLLDSGNGRVLCVDASLTRLRRVLEGEMEGKRFVGAQGLFINGEALYLCDTENGRILRFPLDDQALPISEPAVIAPSGLLFDTQSTPFRPKKLAVDNMNRLFVAAEGVYEGLMEFSADGTFLSYVGANKVTVTLSEQFWRLIATKKQWEGMQKFIPVEFSNLCMDSEQFIYATSRGKTGNSLAIRRLNLNGSDILRAHDKDAVLGDMTGLSASADRTEESYFVDVAAGPYEMFAGLDLTKGRVFVYDSRCTLLYEFGGIGAQVGTFTTPVALVWFPDSRMGVLDRRTGSFTVFRHTVYGRKLLDTVELEMEGSYDQAADCYREILRMNANSEIAYIGVGKQLFRQGEYKEAMRYFKLGNDRQYYSKAYEQQRKAAMAVAIPVIIVSLGIVALAAVVRSVYRQCKALRDSIRKIRQLYR